MNTKYDTLSPDLFEPAVVQEDEKEKIAAPHLNAFQDAWIRLRKNKAAVISMVVIVIILLFAIFAPMLSSYNYRATDYNNIYVKPCLEHPFGTDKYGRDLWVRCWMGTRISLLIGVFAAMLDLFIGVTYGAISALVGGKVDSVMQRVIEILVGVPSLIVIILLMMLMPAGLGTIAVAMAITGWIGMARLVRAEILKLKSSEYVQAAILLGTSQGKIITKHLIPNTVGVIVINTMFTIPSAVFTEAYLSFIGLGLQEPNASLGVLINNGYSVLQSYPHALVFPAVIIVLIMVCFSIFGDGLRDALDPKMRK
ncbi:MAG: ABC transporter permease [Faecousia sp.]